MSVVKNFNMSHMMKWMTTLILVAVVSAVYWQVISRPFVSDDWFILYSIHTHDIAATIAEAFVPFNKLIYRPAAMMYYIVVFKLFGLNPVPFHLLALLLHVCNSTLVGFVLFRISGMKSAAIAAAVLYAGAASVHLDPLLWLVGFYDIAGIFFLLLSFAFFLLKKSRLSVASFVFALLTKEATLFFVGVLIVYVVLLERNQFRRVYPHLVVALLYTALKMMGKSALTIESAHPHRMDVWGKHIAMNLESYAKWLGESLFPSIHESSLLFLGGFLIVILLVAMQSVRSSDTTHRSVNAKFVMFFAIWIVAGILPVLFLRNQAARYYASYSLVPFLFLITYAIVSAISDSRRVLCTVLLSVTVIGSLLSNAMYVRTLFAAGKNEIVTADGRFHLIKKGEIVNTIHSELMLNHPKLPQHATIVLSGPGLMLIGNGIAPKFWYNDTTLQVISLVDYYHLKDSLAPDSMALRNFYFLNLDSLSAEPHDLFESHLPIH